MIEYNENLKIKRPSKKFASVTMSNALGNQGGKGSLGLLISNRDWFYLALGEVN